MTTMPTITEEEKTPPLQAKRKRSFEAHDGDESNHRTVGAVNFVRAPNKRKQLRIEIPTFPLVEDVPEKDSTPLEDDTSGLSAISGLSYDSLFDDIDIIDSSCTSTTTANSSVDSSLPKERGVAVTPAPLTAPDIAGLFFNPSLLLPQELADSVWAFCMKEYFHTPGVNQVMLFGRFSPASSASSTSGLPPILVSLLLHLSTILRLTLPDKAYDLLFPEVPTQSRQAIINLYQPGEGITPHVDLLGRYADGIAGVSFGSGCVMRFDRVDSGSTNSSPSGTTGEGKDRCNVYLPERSVIVLSEDARYRWTHGIDKCVEDYVSLPESELTNGEKLDDADGAVLPPGRWLERGVRLSVTFRWLLPGANVVGDS